MTALKKVMESKTVKEAVCNVPDGFFNFMSSLLIFAFMINPLLILMRKLIPFVPDSSNSINRITLMIGILLLALFVARHLLLGKKLNVKLFLKSNLPITLFLAFGAVMLVTTLINGHFDITLFGNAYRDEGLFGFLSYIVYFVLVIMNNNPKHKKVWLYTLAASSAIISAAVIYECYAHNTHTIDFIFSHYNHLGYYLVTAFGVSAMLVITSEKVWQKAIFSVSGFMTALALIANDTFGCQLAAVAGVVFICVIYSIAKSRFKAVTLVPAAILVFAVVLGYATSERMNDLISANLLQTANDSQAIVHGKEEAEFSTGVSRMILWEMGMDYIIEKPITGHGADVTGEEMQTLTNDSDRCHCEYMNYAISFGIPAVLLYIAAVFAVYLRGLLAKGKLTDINLIGLGAAMFYLVSAVVGNTMYYTAPFLFILLGMGYFTEEPTEAE
ncbi:MAG: O-antigen ligase family protein [Oscillospiraceae bacterium]|nr:O-antigen ligase family protein [Oscillospiraceae bacterium]